MNERLVTACPALCLHPVAWRQGALLLPPIVPKKVPGTEPGEASSAWVCVSAPTYRTQGRGTLNLKPHSILQSSFPFEPGLTCKQSAPPLWTVASEHSVS